MQHLLFMPYLFADYVYKYLLFFSSSLTNFTQSRENKVVDLDACDHVDTNRQLFQFTRDLQQSGSSSQNLWAHYSTLSVVSICLTVGFSACLHSLMSF